MALLLLLALLTQHMWNIASSQKMATYGPLSYLSAGDQSNWQLTCYATVQSNDGTVRLLPGINTAYLSGSMASKTVLSPDEPNFELEVRVKTKSPLGDGYAIYITPSTSVDRQGCCSSCTMTHYGVLKPPGLTLGIRVSSSAIIIAAMFPNDTNINYPIQPQASIGFAWPFVSGAPLDSPYFIGRCPSALLDSYNGDLSTKISLFDGNITLEASSWLNDSYAKNWTCADSVPAPGLVSLIQRGDAVVVISGGYGGLEFDDNPVVQSVQFNYPTKTTKAAAATTSTQTKEPETWKTSTSTSPSETQTTTWIPTEGLSTTYLQVETADPSKAQTSSSLDSTSTPEVVEGPWNVTLHDLGTCGNMEVTGNVNLSDGTVLSGMVWNKDLDDHNTKTFELALEAFEPILRDIYQRLGSNAMEDVEDIAITGFRQGSIISDYIVTLRTLTELSEAEIQAKVDQVLTTIRKSAISYGKVSASQIVGVTITSSVLKRIYIPNKTALTASPLATTVKKPKTNSGNSCLVDAQWRSLLVTMVAPFIQSFYQL